jgi:hypothetical protein
MTGKSVKKGLISAMISSKNPLRFLWKIQIRTHKIVNANIL